MTWNRALTGVFGVIAGMLASNSVALPAQAQPLPAQEGLPVEARQVLGRFVGDWQVVVSIDGIPNQGLASADWTLEGSYVEFRSHTVPAGDSDLQVMTYDNGAYHQWLFDSSGYRHQASGTWDAATTTLIWRAPGLLIEDHWVGPDRLEWTMTRDDRQIIGVVTRRGGK